MKNIRMSCKMMLCIHTHAFTYIYFGVFFTYRQAIGYPFKTLTGQYDGYYCLHLSQYSHQICLRRLIEVSEVLKIEQFPLSPIGEPGRVGVRDILIYMYLYVFVLKRD
jgi:hypothetical protein